MNIAITTTKNMDLTDAIRDYIGKRLKTFEKLIGKDAKQTTFFVEVGKTSKHHKTGDIFKAEIRSSIGKDNLYATSTESDLYAAIDKVKDEIASEIKKIKGKKRSLVKKGGKIAKSIIKKSSLK